MSETELGGIDLDSVPPIRTVRLTAVPDAAPATRWLVQDLWPAEGVGIVAATPKAGKTWLAVDLGISVASATPFAGRFPVHHPGKVLMLACEDRNDEMKDRAHGLASARGLSFDNLAFELIDEPILTLNRPKDLARLERRIREDRPALVILDPLRRVYSGNESSSDGVSALLAQLRRIQRQYHVAILLTHHVTKQSEYEPVSGSSMRGSGDLHAWGDANIYAWRTRQDESAVVVKLEHRNAPPQPPFLLRRVSATTPSGGSTAYLEFVEGDVSLNGSNVPATQKVDELRQRVLGTLSESKPGVGFNALRGQLGVGAEKLSAALTALEGEGLIAKVRRVWTLRSVPASQPGDPPVGNGATEPR